MKDLRALLVKHEGIRLKPYKDTEGVLTIGVGRNLEHTGITHEEAMYLLENDMHRVMTLCMNELPWFLDLSRERETVIANMVFNLGMAGFLKFTKMIAAIELSQWDRAADEMLASQWAEQVGMRAVELAAMMRGETSSAV